MKHGTGGINIDASRVQYADENDRSGWHKTGGGGKGYQDTDTFKIREITPEEIQERTKDGRFPANVMHDGSDVVKDIFPKTGTKGKAKHPDSNPDFRDVAKKAMEQGGQDKLNFNQVTGAKRKTTNRKPRDGNNVWTDENSGMKQEENHFADADPKGRYPANVMHDGSDVVRDIFPNSKGFVSNGNAKVGETSKGAIPPLRRGNATSYGDEGSASRYFYCPKTSAEERNRGLENFTAKPMAWGNQAKAELKRGNLDFKGKGTAYKDRGLFEHNRNQEKGDGSKHNKVAMRLNTHPTVKPQELMKYLCRLVTPKGGVVLDPFMRSGSTGMAAKDEGFDFIGIEKEQEYFEIAEARIKVSSPLMEFM